MRLHNLKAPKGANRNRKRVGRGESSGWGKTSGTGHGGQKSRSGKGKPRPGFEGGQTPMYRRMPKRGFTNIFAKQWAEVNVDLLGSRFPAGTTVDLEAMRAAGLASRRDDGFRVLGRGEISHALTVSANHFSAAAREKLETAGGKAILVAVGKKPEAAAAPAPAAAESAAPEKASEETAASESDEGGQEG